MKFRFKKIDLKFKIYHLKLLVGLLVLLGIGTSIYLYLHRDLGGILVVNTSKSVYSPNETILFQIASLDTKGNTLCNSKLKLEIYVPEQKKPETPHIITTSTCNPDNNVTNEPDYITRFITTKTGVYKIKLTNRDTRKKIVSSFKVKDTQPELVIERSGATRINPFKSDRYPMSITVTANQDYSGELVESIPATYKLAWYGNAKVTSTTLTWQLTLKQGESKTFSYEYIPEKISPALFTLGPITINKSQITNSLWFIASDTITKTKKSAFADLVRLTSLRKDWTDNLKKSISQEFNL